MRAQDDGAVRRAARQRAQADVRQLQVEGLHDGGEATTARARPVPARSARRAPRAPRRSARTCGGRRPRRRSRGAGTRAAGRPARRGGRPRCTSACDDRPQVDGPCRSGGTRGAAGARSRRASRARRRRPAAPSRSASTLRAIPSDAWKSSKRADAEQRVAQDQQRPALADDLQRARDASRSGCRRCGAASTVEARGLRDATQRATVRRQCVSSRNRGAGSTRRWQVFSIVSAGVFLSSPGPVHRQHRLPRHAAGLRRRDARRRCPGSSTPTRSCSPRCSCPPAGSPTAPGASAPSSRGLALFTGASALCAARAVGRGARRRARPAGGRRGADRADLARRCCCPSSRPSSAPRPSACGRRWARVGAAAGPADRRPARPGVAGAGCSSSTLPGRRSSRSSPGARVLREVREAPSAPRAGPARRGAARRRRRRCSCSASSRARLGLGLRPGARRLRRRRGRRSSLFAAPLRSPPVAGRRARACCACRTSRWPTSATLVFFAAFGAMVLGRVAVPDRRLALLRARGRAGAGARAGDGRGRRRPRRPRSSALTAPRARRACRAALLFAASMAWLVLVMDGQPHYVDALPAGQPARRLRRRPRDRGAVGGRRRRRCRRRASRPGPAIFSMAPPDRDRARRRRAGGDRGARRTPPTRPASSRPRGRRWRWPAVTAALGAPLGRAAARPPRREPARA